MGTKKVRVLAAYQVPHLNAVSGDVVEVDSADADTMIAAGSVEAAPNASLSSAGAPEPVQPEPLPVRSGPYEPPEGAKEQLEVGKGGNTPYPEPLPVHSGPYEPPEGAREQLDVAEGGSTPPFEPLVADPDDAIRPTDEQGNPDYDITEKTENLTPAGPQDRAAWYDEQDVPALKAEAKRRGLKGYSTLSRAKLIAKLKADDG